AGLAGAALASRALAEGGAPGGGMQPRGAGAAQPPAAPGPGRYVLVAFAGGVRSRETIGAPANIPNLMAIAGEGVVMPSVKTANLGHYGAALAICTGCGDARGIRENARGDNPTLFEYARKQLGLPPEEVWLSAADGAQTVNFSHSLHPDYGAPYGANLIGSDGLFNAEFRDVVNSLGKPRVPGEEESRLVDRLSRAMDRGRLDAAEDRRFAADPEHARRMQKFILGELTGGTANITGPGAGDAKAIRVAANILRVFRPRLIGIVLGNADVAHGSYNAYVDVIRRNDAELGLLWKAVRDDPALRDDTTIFVLPEIGRDSNLNQRNGLDHGDGSEDLQRVACIAAGPRIAKGRVHDRMVDAVDVAPTIAALMGVRTPEAKGKPIRAILTA
ncbi:MAG: hypothetical protein L6R43_15715, partial [Planctomycetes bacterium]|nr:hypothetical protein [Planctomycetota bacterium]